MNRKALTSLLLAGLAAAFASCAPAGPAGGGAADQAALANRLSVLEARASRVQDADDVRRLQHAYGYYLDEGLWDQAANLFAEDGTIEIGLDGVYVGRERVRAYLYALGGGRAGLPPGRLNEHLQVMPVVDVAVDGRSAKARWREILMVGSYGENAFWGEGPMENEYVKQDGVWKIKSVHWYEHVLTPYDGGWQVHADPTHGIHVSPQLPPDRPPSVDYETWPAVYLPPYHFPNPVTGGPSLLGVVVDAPMTDEPTASPSPDELAARAAALGRHVALMEDEDAVENLQRTFGYYVDKDLWTQAAGLFADDATIELGAQGVYVGRERVLAYLRHLGPEGPTEGRLNDTMQLQPIVDVAPDGRTARGRWRMFSQTGVHGEYARWGLGLYDVSYVKDAGVWKIASLHLFNTMTTPYENGWGEFALPNPGPLADFPPDRPSTVDYSPYPAAVGTPFHFRHPVMEAGARTPAPVDAAVPGADDLEALAGVLDALEQRIARLEDVEAVSRLDTIRAYYLANSQWDDTGVLFASDGGIEIAMRGVYIGPASVRRSLDLYTPPGVQQELLHNHMAFQRVIHVAPDGMTAHARSKAFSIMGQFGRYGNWMGGTYENEFVKEDGVWKIKTDHQYNTYFASYASGWENLRLTPPPGVSADIPPDLPPTHPFQMYPAAFLPPFHYPNPVTGEAVTWEGAE